MLDGYYAVSGLSPYRTFYKTTNGNVVDIITMETSVSTTGSSVNSGSHNVISDSKDYTSGWFLNSHLTKDLDLNVYNNTNNLIIDWNTSNFYNSEYVTRGLIKNFTTKDSLVLYGDNTTSTEIDNSTTEAEEQFYRQIFPFDSEIFVYDREDTLTIKPVEVCNTGGPNGINYQILDSNGNPIPSYVGVEFNSNIYTGSSILYSSTTVTILGSEYEKYVDLPDINSGDITNVTISITSPNPHLKTTFTTGDFSGCTAQGPCVYYSGTTYQVNSYGYIQSQKYDEISRTSSTQYEFVYEGQYQLTDIIEYGSIYGALDADFETNLH